MTDIETRTELALEVTDLKILLTDLLGEPGRGRRWLCPFHADKTPDLSVKGHKFHCFACGESGNAFDILRQTQGWGFMESLKWLERRAGLNPAIVGESVKRELRKRRAMKSEKDEAEAVKNRRMGDLATMLVEIRRGIRQAQAVMPAPVAVNYLDKAYQALQRAEYEYDTLLGSLH